jgi:hypothetical protein
MPSFTKTSQNKPLFEFIRKQQDNERFVRSLEIGGTFMLISFFLLFAIKPTAYTISSLLGEIQSKEVLVKQLRAKIANVIQAQEAFSQVQGKYQLIESSLPDSPRYNHAYTQLFGSAQNAGIPLNSVSFSLEDNSPYPPESHIETYTSPLNLKTTFPKVISLLNHLTNNRRLVKIKGLSFQIEKDKNQDTSTDTIRFTCVNQYLYWNQNTDEKK